jgi:hypothetical protein
MFKDYYSILELDKNASKNEIRKAYRRLAKKYHPDVYKSDDAHEKFIEITEAYEILINNSYRYYTAPTETTTTTEWRDAEYRKNEEYEKFRQEARAKAQKQAKMRFEEFQKQNEVFQKSGLNDLFLIFKIITRVAAIFIFLFLLILPVYTSICYDWTTLFILFLTWPVAAVIAWNIYDNRKNYFLPGKFFYNIKEIKRIFNETKSSEESCFYCSNKLADGKQYKIELLKLIDIKLKTGGFRQHTVNYLNDKAIVLIPRSRKAFKIHSVNTLIKITTLLACMIFIDIHSLLWRIIIGFVLSGIVCSLILIISRTKSNVSYLFNFNLITRVCIWLFLISELSHIGLHPFDISTSDVIFFAVTAIIFFDCILMQGIGMILGKHSSIPIIGQYNEVKKLFDNGYTAYNELPVFSVIYPLFKWIFG